MAKSPPPAPPRPHVGSGLSGPSGVRSVATGVLFGVSGTFMASVPSRSCPSPGEDRVVGRVPLPEGQSVEVSAWADLRVTASGDEVTPRVRAAVGPDFRQWTPFGNGTSDLDVFSDGLDSLLRGVLGDGEGDDGEVPPAVSGALLAVLGVARRRAVSLALVLRVSDALSLLSPDEVRRACDEACVRSVQES